MVAPHQEPTGSQDAQPQRPLPQGAAGRAISAMLRPRSIRAKLIRILLVSLALVLVLLGFLITGQVSNLQAADQTTRIVTVTLSVQDAVHQLQKERGLTNGLLGGDLGFKTQVAAQRPQTDRALGALNQTIDDPANADAGADQVRTALSKLDSLADTRGQVDDGQAQSATTFQFYSDAISALNGLDLGLDQAQDGTLRHALQALYALGNAKEYTGQERGLLNGVFAANRFSTANYTKFAEILGQKQAALTEFAAYATPTERNALDNALRSPSATTGADLENIAIGGASGTLTSRVDPQTWWNAMTTVINSLRTVQQQVGQDVTARANQLQSIATQWLVGIGILAALTVAAMVTLVIGAARSVIGPLGVLAREANDVSARRLPETVARLQTEDTDVPTPTPVAVPRGAATEIALVAKALDRVQETAVTLASEQALIRRNTTASLANLGHRNQNLVRRQLSLISDFEREELDPSALANMFELDHLATRMRRNAESLLVLVGEASPRPWAEPLPVVDVIRAALSEVEDYRRVVLRKVDAGWVAGAAVAEVAHMLAELVENGLFFSPPDLEVEIYGRRMGSQYLLVVVDCGVGMPPAELARAKARLRDEESFLVAPTKFLGHYVVGRLARRLGVQVDLSESPVTGLTARILLPSPLLADDPAKKQDPARKQPATVGAQPVANRPAASKPAMPAARPIRKVETTTTSPSGAGSSPAHRWPTEPESASATPSRAQSAARKPVAAPPPAQVAARVNGSAPERTRNGLVKRQPRDHSAAPAGGPPAPARPPSIETTPATDRSPNEVGSMLAAFRRGHQRGEHSASNAENTVTRRLVEEELRDR